MTLTPQDVHSQTFRERIRGYSEEEVDEFMARVADALAILTNERDEALARAEALESRTGDTDEADLLKRTLMTAERAAQHTLAEARDEAEQLLAEAREAADRLVEQARADADAEREQARRGADRIRQAVGDLRAFRDDYLDRVRSVVAEQLSMLERMSDIPEMPPLIDAIEDVASDATLSQPHSPAPHGPYSDRPSGDSPGGDVPGKGADRYPEGPGPVLADESGDVPHHR